MEDGTAGGPGHQCCVGVTVQGGLQAAVWTRCCTERVSEKDINADIKIHRFRGVDVVTTTLSSSTESIHFKCGEHGCWCHRSSVGLFYKTLHYRQSHIRHHTCFLCTCGGNDGLAHQADAGAMASQHGDVVVLPARQVGEVAVGVVAVALGAVAEASPGVHRVGRGALRRVPGDHSDSGLAVDSCGEVSGNAGRWWGGK